MSKSPGESVVAVIEFLPMGLTATAQAGETLLDLARRHELPVPVACGGKGICGKCKVKITKADESLVEPSSREIETLGPLIQRGYRLACEVIPTGLMEVTIFTAGQTGGSVILTSHAAYDFKVRLNTTLKAHTLEIPPPSLEAPVSDQERLLSAVRTKCGYKKVVTDLSLLRRLPKLLRQYDGRLTAVIRNQKEVVDIRSQRRNGLYGIAFDIGTTTVVGYLLDLENGEKISVRSALNPQTTFGADLISRIAHCQENYNGLEQLRLAVLGCLNSIVSETCQEAGIEPQQIIEATAVGNTAMHHLLLGIDPRYLATAPYPPAITKMMDVKARDLGLSIGTSAFLHLPPIKGGFVGSDITACVLATGVHRSKVPTLLIDLGTNGEIVFGNRDRLVCCSTAAGPAFEGGHIRWGMRAADGAIERIRMAPGSLEVEIVTIGHQRPTGICGSGIISATAELLRNGFLLQSGNFDQEMSHPRLRRGNDGWEFVLAWSEQTEVGEDIVLTQGDLSELVMAKAAVHAGACLLIEHACLGQPQRILMAGACGNYVDPQDTLCIDLLPNGLKVGLTGVGNAAGHGACLALLNKSKRNEAARIAIKSEYLELAASARFQELFVAGMFFTSAKDYGDHF